METFTQRNFYAGNFHTQKLAETFTNRKFTKFTQFFFKEELLHRNLYTEELLLNSLRTDAFTDRRVYTQTRLHIDVFTWRNFYTENSLHRNFYRQKLLHGKTFTHKGFYTQTRLHAQNFTQRSLYTVEQIHTETFTRRRVYTHNFLHRRFCTEKSSHRWTFTDRNFYTEKFLHRVVFTYRTFYTQTRFSTEMFTVSLSRIIHSIVIMRQQLHSLFTIFSSWFINCHLHIMFLSNLFWSSPSCSSFEPHCLVVFCGLI
jgi:hypothetical protein